MSAAAVIAAARACDGTPFHHQGRQPGVGLDCVGLLIHAFGAAGYRTADSRGYARQPDPAAMRAALERVLVPATGEPRAGDVLYMRINRDPQHLALVTGAGTIIHACANVGRVREHRLDDRWRRRVVAVYRHPEVVS